MKKRHPFRRLFKLWIIISLIVAACGVTSTEVTQLPTEVPAQPTSTEVLSSEKFITYANSDLELIPGQYLVVFDNSVVSENSVDALANTLVDGTTGTVSYLFTQSLRGFEVINLTDDWARTVSERADVSFVRKDFQIYGKELRGPVPWNLDRIDQRAPFRLDRDYRFKTGPVGTNPPVPIYILDNGVYQDHQEFASPTGIRVENIADVKNTNFAICGLSVADAGHGTSMASIAAGARLGITSTLIKNVKVLDRGALGTSCTGGSPTDVLKGLEETHKHMRDNNITKAVVNLSLGWYGSTPDVATAISNLQKLGAIVVAAGGNENKDALGITPANLPDVIAVGATTDSDTRLFVSSTNASNFGSTIDLWAPGYNIKAADWTLVPAPTAFTSVSGTSAAAAHVSGAVALLWQQNPNMNSSDVRKALLSRVTRHMLTNLGPGSNNALLYIGEDAPLQGPKLLINRVGGDSDLRSVRVSIDGARLYVAGGRPLGTIGRNEPYAYAGYTIPDINALPNWQLGNADDPATPTCVDIASGTPIDRGISGEYIYFACQGTHNGAEEAAVIAVQQNNLAVWPQTTWLGSGSVIGGVTAGISVNADLRVYTIASRLTTTGTGTEVFIASFDGYDGRQLASKVLTGPGFTENIHQAVDLVLVNTLDNFGNVISTELVAATFTDAAVNKTFLWKLDPDLNIADWREMPASLIATTEGMIATALAVQPSEIIANRVIPGEVFLATFFVVQTGNSIDPWGYIYRLNPDRVTGSQIEVVQDGYIKSLWSEDGDIYFGGSTTRTFPPGNLSGIRKPGSIPDSDAFLGKSEGIYQTRRWIITFDTPGAQNNSGYGGYGARNGFIVGSDSNIFYIVRYPVY